MNERDSALISPLTFLRAFMPQKETNTLSHLMKDFHRGHSTIMPIQIMKVGQSILTPILNILWTQHSLPIALTLPPHLYCVCTWQFL